MTHSSSALFSASQDMLDARDRTWHASTDRVPIVMCCASHTYRIVASAVIPGHLATWDSTYQACNAATEDAR